jgi:hypothetical protein
MTKYSTGKFLVGTGNISEDSFNKEFKDVE